MFLYVLWEYSPPTDDQNKFYMVFILLYLLFLSHIRWEGGWKLSHIMTRHKVAFYCPTLLVSSLMGWRWIKKKKKTRPTLTLVSKQNCWKIPGMLQNVVKNKRWRTVNVFSAQCRIPVRCCLSGGLVSGHCRQTVWFLRPLPQFHLY